MIRRSIFLALLAVFAGGSSRVPSPMSVEADVYAALLDSLERKPLPDTLLVGDSSLRFRAPTGGVSSWRGEFNAIPPDLPRRLEAASRKRVPSHLLGLPRPLKVLTRAELAEIFGAGPAGWIEFHRRYPHQRSYIELSPVAFSTDSLDALVYYEYHCGGRCGGGDAVWLSRTSTASGWHVRKRIPFWVS